jgi:hypothetical protein
MQMLALLWFELQFTSNISVKSFWRSKVTAKTRDSTSASSVEPNSLNRVRINCYAPVEPVQQKLGRKFVARVVGTARAINLTAKRLLTELEAPNQTGELFPDRL